MVDLRLSKHWDREVESDLPDCRLKHGERQQVMLGGRVPVEAVYCANCGGLHGYATVWTPHVFFICDACVGRNHGETPPGCSEITKKQLAERGLRVVPI